MSATMFNFVIPEIREDFRLPFSQVSWVSAIYLLIYAIGAVIYGKLADTFKLKNLLTFGLFFFFAGSLVGLASQAYWMVLLARVLQSVGASVIPATAMIIPVRYFPAETRGRALGISATGLATGNAVGPVVSALVVSFLHWRWLFCIPLLVLFTLPFYRKYLNHEQGGGGRIDWLGGGLLAGTVALLMLAVTTGEWQLAAGSALFLIGFLARIRTAKEPFVQPRLFRNRQYTQGLVLSVLIMGVGFSLSLLTPQLLADVHRLEPGWIGFAMVPAAVISALLGRKGGKLADAKGNPFLFMTASGLLIVCFALMSSFTGISPVWISVFLVFGNVGQMFIGIALSNTLSRTLPKEQTGVGMGLMQLLSFLSSAVSAGIYSKVTDHGAGLSLNPLNAEPESYIYGNVYAVLALSHIGILVFYRFVFSRVRQAGD
nr:MFS transporter [Cohnella sp. YIM B05605]